MEEVKILKGQKKLSERSRELDVLKENKLIQETIIKMKSLMKTDSTITVLTAPQVGKAIRIVVVNFKGELKSFVNPIIQETSGIVLSKEECHSIPGKKFIRIRNTSVVVYYMTPLGKVKTSKFEGKGAIVMQHAIDHLDGILLNDIGFEVDEDFESATEEERAKIIDLYLESLDVQRKDLEEAIESDPQEKQIRDAVRFVNSVRNGETILEHVEKEDKETSNG